jgi:hypothetical protein
MGQICWIDLRGESGWVLAGLVIQELNLEI